MKASFLLLCIVLGITGKIQAQTSGVPIDPDTKKIMFRSVVDQEGNALYLYDKVIAWFGYYYPNPQAVYAVQDKVNGKVEGNARMKIYYKDDKTGARLEGGTLQYLIKIELKDNKYRYTLTEFKLRSASGLPIERWLNKSDPAYNSNWDSYLYQVDTTMQRLVLTLKEKMKPTVIKKDEW